MSAAQIKKKPNDKVPDDESHGAWLDLQNKGKVSITSEKPLGSLAQFPQHHHGPHASSPEAARPTEGMPGLASEARQQCARLPKLLTETGAREADSDTRSDTLPTCPSFPQCRRGAREGLPVTSEIRASLAGRPVG